MLELKFDPFPTLHTTRLTMRHITLDDTAALFELRSNPEVMQHIDRPLAVHIDEARVLIESLETGRTNNESVTWGITLKNSPTVIGTIGYWRIAKEHYRAEIGYLLHPKFQRQGIMSEAMAAAIAYGFQSMRLHSIEANVSPDNIASIGLLERTGFVREAYFRENYFWNSRFLDTAVYCLLDPRG